MKINIKMTRKKSIILLSSVVLLIMALFVGNRVAFGVWDPLQLPNRIQCYSRTYRKSATQPKVLIGEGKPTYSIFFWDNPTSKPVYTIDPKINSIPTVVYLKMSSGRYQLYELSGSP